MTLTFDDVQKLTAYFEAREHEFLRDFTYITESAITSRLDSVDPNWTFEILNMTTRGEQITVHGRLYVSGVWRDGVGMAKSMSGQSGNETNEPEKSAATDALKRCARLFGIGRYLLDLPGKMNMQSLEKWLIAQNAPQSRSTASNSSAGVNQAQPQASTENNAGEPIPFVEPGAKEWWSTFWPIVIPMYDNQKHAQNSVKKMTDGSMINSAKQTVAQAVEVVRKHLAEKTA